jgi:hypothetical protein
VELFQIQDSSLDTPLSPIKHFASVKSGCHHGSLF